MNPTRIIIHHSLTKDDQTVSWNAIRSYHINECGWKDVGYHYGIELIGNDYDILKGRMDNEEGAHCLGYNDHSIGICVVGNFDLIRPCINQLNLLKKLCNSLMEIYGIKADCVLGHRETYALRNKPVEKTCPGARFDMVEFRKSL